MNLDKQKSYNLSHIICMTCLRTAVSRYGRSTSCDFFRWTSL